MMILSHFSAVPFTLCQRSYDQSRADFKPKGLWLTDVDEDISWKEWCKAEKFRLEGLAHRTDMDVSDLNLLQINSDHELLALTKSGKPMFPGDNQFGRYNAPDWKEIVSAYDGIAIIPYQWSLRMHDECFWYYPWDCNSACIWSGLDKIKVMGQIEQAA
jgi:hypothetical protein